MMYDFRIIPDDCPDSSVRLSAPDGGEALVIVKRLGCSRADVLRDGAYLFSICRLGRDGAFWSVFQRRELPWHPGITEFG